MRWTAKELLLELELDPGRRVLFLEGNRDLVFWRDTVPLRRGPGVVLYPISFLDCEQGDGGERGRLIRAARLFQASSAADRVHFFPFFGRAPPPNVTFTDGRDLESYAISNNCLGHICNTGFATNRETGSALLSLLTELARPIGILRIASERAALGLPFQRTLSEQRGGIKRFIGKVRGRPVLDLPALMTTLLQNGGHGHAALEGLNTAYQEEQTNLASVPDTRVIQGKDLIGVLAAHFGVTAAEMERLLFMSLAIERDQIRLLDNVRELQDWMDLAA